MKRDILNVYFIMGTADASNPLQVLEEALKSGITCFQFREKGEKALKGEAYERFARECQKLCNQYQVPFIVNDDVSLALKLRADGIHIGQDDAPISEVRKLIGDKLLGISVHTEEEVEEALKEGADYVGIGPIYPTISKADAKAPAGTTFLKSVSECYPQLPIVAIGGINEQNAREVVEAGADGVAVISVICRSRNIKETVRRLKLSDT